MAAMRIFPDEAFDFYEGLEADNSKTYWTEHKHVYERAVREPMRMLLEKLAPEFDAEDVVIYRPYRDVRFSKDKTVYKTEQGGYLKLDAGVGYYVQVDAEGVLVGGGFFTSDRDHIARYRAAVDSELTGPELAAITERLQKAGYGLGGVEVKTRPRGVPADHPRLALMRKEFLTARRLCAPETVTIASVRKDFKTLIPLIDWVRHNAPAPIQQDH